MPFGIQRCNNVQKGEIMTTFECCGITAEDIYDPLVHMFTTWESTEEEMANENKHQVITQPGLMTDGYHLYAKI